MTSTEVDGACSSRLTGVNGGGGGAEAKQVDCLEDPVDDPPEATPSGTTTTPPVVGASAAGAKPSQGGTTSSTSSSSSLHRVADKLKEKLNRQMLDDEGQDGEPVSGLKKESTNNNNNNNNHVQKSGSETRSQYHSILKLSSPSSKSFAAAAVSRSFSPSNQNSYDFSSSSSTTGPRYYGHHAPPPELYPPGVADTLDVLRGMIKGPDGGGGGGGGLLLGGGGRKDLASYGAQADQSKMIGCYAEYEDGGGEGGGGGGDNAFAKNKYSSYLNNSDDDESLFQSDTLGDSVISADEFSDRDFSCRKGNYGNSRSSSLSSEKHLNHHHRGRDEEEEEEEEEEDGRGEGEEEEEEEGGAGNNCVEDSFCSDWSPGNRIEAKKKARVENIISNMRPSPNGKTAAAAVERREEGEMLDPPTPIAASNGLLDTRCLPAAVGGQSTEVRRPKRKQYIPQQHDARESEEADEPPAAKLRKVEKDAMHQQLQRMQEQLNEMQQRCFRLLDNDQSFDDDDDDDDDYADDDNDDEEEEDEDERKGDARLIVGRLRSDLNRNEIQRLSNGILQTLRGDDGKELIERATRQIGALPPPLPPSSSSSSSDAAGRMSGLRHLATLLKAEITTSVGMLVDGIVKNFMAKHFDANDNNKEAATREASTQSPKTIALEPLSLREPAQFKQQRDEPFLPVGKPLEAPPLAITRPPPPCLPPPTLLPPPLSLPVHPSFSEPSILAQSVTQQQQQQQQQRQRELAEKYMRPYFDLRGKTAFDIPHQAHLPLFAPHPFYPPPPPPPPPMAKFQPLFVKEPEQTEALPLVVSTPKKKRTKVTDTRLSPRAARAMLQDSLGPQHHQNHHHHHQQHHPQQQQQQQHPDGHHHHHHGGPQASSHRNGGDSSSRKSSFPHHHHHPHHLHHFSALGGIHEAFPHPSMLSIGLPTSVAIHNPSLQHSDLLQTMYPLPPPPPQQQQRGGLGGHRDGQVMGHQVVGGSKRSGSDSPDLVNSPNSLLKCDSDAYEQAMVDSMMNYDGLNLTSTLTPMHLRKAKLMFFYVRYPSSAILKIYFPDVKFNKNNTAQLVKWFSNFREFYYIQMEKYARQALAEGLKNVTDLVITADSELYRVLVLHYNRNNQIEVPENFRFVVQATLREFFISIAAEKDQEQSWKKSIYKVIARMDDAVPEYFKSSNWMEQLADG